MLTTILQETALNASEGHMIGKSEMPIEDSVFADDISAGALYGFGVREYGRCRGKVWIDSDDGPVHVGYVFESRRQYEDAPETYLHETWLSVAKVEEIPRRIEPIALSNAKP